MSQYTSPEEELGESNLVHIGRDSELDEEFLAYRQRVLALSRCSHAH